MCESTRVDLSEWNRWLEIMAAKVSWHHMERRGRKQQNMISIRQRKRRPKKTPLIVDKSPSLVYVFKQSLKERGIL